MKAQCSCCKWVTLLAIVLPLVAGCEKREEVPTPSTRIIEDKSSEQQDRHATRRVPRSNAGKNTADFDSAGEVAPSAQILQTTSGKILLPELKQSLDEFRHAVSKARTELDGGSTASQASQLRVAVGVMTEQLMQQSAINPDGKEIIQAYQNEKFAAPLSDLEKRSTPEATRQALKEISDLTDLLEHYLPDYINK